MQAVCDEQGAHHLSGAQNPARPGVLQEPAERAHRREGLLGGEEEPSQLAPPRQGGARGQDYHRGPGVAAEQERRSGRWYLP